LRTSIISCASPTTTSLIFDAGISSPDKNMLGEQIGELKGKIMGQRVLDSEGPRMETTLSSTGSVRGTNVKETVTFVGSPTSAGVLHGKGHGVLMGGESEMATFSGEAFGRISSSGNVKWRGSHFYRTMASSGKLAFLNNAVGVFEAEIDAEGNFTEKIWEWK
jgi:hypothetical protein